MNKAKKYVKWCVANGRKPRMLADDHEEKQLHSWLSAVVRAAKKDGHTTYPEVAEYLTKYLGSS